MDRCQIDYSCARNQTMKMDTVEEKMPASGPKLIDVEQVIAQKSPSLHKLMPSFVIRYLKRIIHQDEVNNFLIKNHHKQGLEFVDAVVDIFNPEVIIQGEHNLSTSKRMVVASNHPLGGLDGVVLMQAIGRVRPDLQFPVNDILLHLENLRPLFIPINKHGSNAENIRIFNQTFQSDAVVSYFPFGLVSRKQKGIIRDLDWKKTFLTKAKAYKRDIVPTHIDGRNTDFFYNLSNIRKRLGIKANIEMLYLADEFFKQKNKTLTITFGEPIPYQLFDKKYPDHIWAERLRGFVYYLASNPEATFDPETDYLKIIC
jgi:putative hemolysin